MRSIAAIVTIDRPLFHKNRSSASSTGFHGVRA
jgi:hypothetical protein